MPARALSRHGNSRRARPPGRSQFRRRRAPRNGAVGSPLIVPTPPSVSRFGFVNISGLPTAPGPYPLKDFLKFPQSKGFAYLGIQEVNLNLSICNAMGSWSRRTAKYPGFSRAFVNEHSSSEDAVLFGGTAYFVEPKLSIRLGPHGGDSSGLGRWSWITLRGKNGMQTRVVTGYRPVVDHSDRPNSVYSQHELYWKESGAPYRCPRAAFLDDLGTLIQGWITSGDQIILGLDANENTRGACLADWASALGLVNVHATMWPDDTFVPTCNKSTISEHPIDAIWCSPGLDVIACGFSGFGSWDLGLRTDHRVLWVDIADESLFGFVAPSPACKTIRHFPLNDPRARKKYGRTLARLRRRHNIPGQVAALAAKSASSQFLPEDAVTYNRLAALDIDLRTAAREGCAPFYAGQVLHSDEIKALRQEIRLWDLMYNHRSKRQVDSRKLRRLMKKLGIHNAFALTVSQIIKKKEDVRKRYSHAKKHQLKLHKETKARLIASRAKANNTTPDIQERADIHTAAMRRHFSNVRRVLDRKPRTNISILECTTPAGDDVQCTSREDIEAACSEEGARRFSQANETPFMQGSLHQQLGFHACQTAVDAILSGSFVPAEDVDEATRAFLAELKMPDAIHSVSPITGFVDAASHSAGWKKMRGRIASSPFGPSFADFIAGSDHDETAAIDAAFSNIPIAAGFIPDLWKKSLDVMIPKKVSSVHVRKLRIIVLFHSLFNMINKRVGRSMIRQADSLGLIPLEAYGSRPGRRANICALNKVLALDILRQLRRAGIICGNDATLCYDRIVHVVASLCMQRLGVTPDVCKVMFGTLQELQHHISTVFGQSSSAYGALRIPLQGIGQGNGAGPAIWLVMTIPLINMLRSRGYGIEVFSPFSQERLFFSCFTFVDDSDSIIAPLNCPTIQGLIREAQKAIDLWGGGLRATGGALSIEKTYWWLVDHSWHPLTQSWRPCSVQSRPGELWLRTTNSPSQRIRRLEMSDAEETLGIWIAPDGNSAAQIAAMTTKINAWSAKISSRQLNRTESWLSLTTGISRTLAYPLAATRLSYPECTRITKALRTSALPALGLPKSMPLVVVHSPQRYLGYGVFDMWFEQGFTQVADAIHFGNCSNDITGSQLRCTMENLRLELGLPKCPLSYDYPTWHLCGTHISLYTSWEFCSRLGLSIRDHLPDLPLQRRHDKFLMEAFFQYGYSPKQLAMLNRCRLYRRVIYLSDLTTGAGLALQDQALSARDPLPMHSNLSWPLQAMPNAHSWSLWRDALLRCFLGPSPSASVLLTQPLGEWLFVPPGWPAFLDPATQHLYVRRDDLVSFSHFVPLATGYPSRKPRVRFQDTVSTFPSMCLPTTTSGRGAVQRVQGYSPIYSVVKTPIADWWGIVIRWPEFLQHLLDGILGGTGIAVTDGSCKNNWGTAAYIIRPALTDNQNNLVLANQTPGDSSDIDPYRAELAGMYGILCTIRRLLSSVDPTTLQDIPFTIACDCKSALDTLFSCYDPLPTTAHYDLLMASRLELRQSPLRWVPHHVRGHRDRVLPYHLLSPWEQLNCDMDALAKTYWHTIDARGFTPHYLLDSGPHWSIWRKEARVTSWSRPRIEDLYYGSPADSFWTRKLHFDTGACDWDALRHAFRQLPTARRLWIPRWLCSMVPLQSTLFRWGLTPTDLCPRCHLPETRQHVVRCPHVDNLHLFEKALVDLEKWMYSQHTHPSLRAGVLSMLRSWRNDVPWEVPECVPVDHYALLTSQADLGLLSLADGFVVRSWTAIQHAHYLSFGSRRTGTRWTSLLIRRIWQIAWAAWQHRYNVSQSADSLLLSRRHSALDDEISEIFTRDLSSIPGPARRWFRRSPSALHSESLDFKLLWLRNVKAWLA